MGMVSTRCLLLCQRAVFTRPKGGLCVPRSLMTADSLLPMVAKIVLPASGKMDALQLLALTLQRWSPVHHHLLTQSAGRILIHDCDSHRETPSLYQLSSRLSVAEDLALKLVILHDATRPSGFVHLKLYCIWLLLLL
jgi:hypothetical protein